MNIGMHNIEKIHGDEGMVDVTDSDICERERLFWDPEAKDRREVENYLAIELEDDVEASTLLHAMCSWGINPFSEKARYAAADRLIAHMHALIRRQAEKDALPITVELPDPVEARAAARGQI